MAYLQDAVKLPDDLTKEFREVHAQARNHMSRDGLTDLLDKKRPNEDPAVKAYRDENKVNITRDIPYSWLALVSRVYTNSEFKLNKASVTLQEYLDSRPFEYNNKRYSLMSWFFSVALPECIEDPNGLFVVWPDKNDYEDTNQYAKPKVKFFDWDQYVGSVKYDGEDFMYLAIEIEPSVIGNSSGLHEHWLCNKERIIKLRDEYADGKIQTVLVWDYPHLQGRIPVVGTISHRSRLKNKLYICESILGSAFELADDANQNYSNSQGVRILHDFPIRIFTEMPDLVCRADGCTDGTIYNSDGSESRCKRCHGSGWDLNISEYSSLIAPEKVGLTVQSRTPIIYAQPDTASINNSSDFAFSLVTKAKKTLGLDLVGVESESGVAREMRLEELQDKLGWVANQAKMFLENILGLFEGYLVIEPSKRVEPIIFVPKVLKLKNGQMLLDEAKEALPADRYNKQMAYIEDQYMDDPIRVRAFALSYEICPSLLFSEEELTNKIAAAPNIYNEFVVYTRDTIQPIIQKIIYENEDATDENIITKALAKVRLNYNATREVEEQSKPIIDPNGDIPRPASQA